MICWGVIWEVNRWLEVGGRVVSLDVSMLEEWSWVSAESEILDCLMSFFGEGEEFKTDFSFGISQEDTVFGLFSFIIEELCVIPWLEWENSRNPFGTTTKTNE